MGLVPDLRRFLSIRTPPQTQSQPENHDRHQIDPPAPQHHHHLNLRTGQRKTQSGTPTKNRTKTKARSKTSGILFTFDVPTAPPSDMNSRRPSFFRRIFCLKVKNVDQPSQFHPKVVVKSTSSSSVASEFLTANGPLSSSVPSSARNKTKSAAPKLPPANHTDVQHRQLGIGVQHPTLNKTVADTGTDTGIGTGTDDVNVTETGSDVPSSLAHKKSCGDTGGPVLLQESAVIADYRDRVLAHAFALDGLWRKLDAEPDDARVTLRLRHHRLELSRAMESYFAARGSRSTTELGSVVHTLDATDRRLASLDGQMDMEVTRFESAVNDIKSRADMKHIPSASVIAEANETLVELQLYDSGWALVMPMALRERLKKAAGLLQHIIACSNGHEKDLTARNGQTRERTAAIVTSVQSGDDSAIRKVKSRTRKLSDLAQNALSKDGSEDVAFVNDGHMGVGSLDSNYNGHHHADQSSSLGYGDKNNDTRDTHNLASPRNTGSMTGGGGFGGGGGGGGGAGSESSSHQVDVPPGIPKSISFASAFYRTNNVRVDAISDAGVTLEKSVVLGDGRCLFRALVRCRAFAMHKPGLMRCERSEREQADQLRARAVTELKAHRQLLSSYFVIEGDFDDYTRSMCRPSTYAGEPELLVLAKILHIPIAVYVIHGDMYRRIQVYGKQYRGEPYRLLYSDNVHYDSLLPHPFSFE